MFECAAQERHTPVLGSCCWLVRRKEGINREREGERVAHVPGPVLDYLVREYWSRASMASLSLAYSQSSLFLSPSTLLLLKQQQIPTTQTVGWQQLGSVVCRWNSVPFCYEKFIFLLFKWKFAVIVVLSRSLVPFPGPVCKNSVEISSRVSFVAKSQCGTFKGVWTSVTRCFIGKYECPRVGRLQ